MDYNFDKIINRRNTASLKWDILKENELPMWVADMDFETAPEITEAVKSRAQSGIYGYNIIPDEWYEAYINWWKTRHGFEMKKEWLIFSAGIVPTISSVVRKLTTPNENVVIQTPVYNIFFNSIINNGAKPLQNKLIYKDGEYSIDFEDLEAKLADSQTTLMLLCNPQNPSGRIWNRQELEKIGELAAKHGVTVISDEIHCDITEPGKSYIPFMSVNETCRMNSITCISPTKCFNIAGLQTSAVCVCNEHLRNRVNRALNTDEIAEPNTFAIGAAVAAFTKGADWLDAMCAYVYENKAVVKDFLEKNLPDIKLVDSKASYLLWLDISALNKPSGEVANLVRKASGLVISAGSAYGDGGDTFLRMNIACPRKTLLEGLARFEKGIKSIN